MYDFITANIPYKVRRMLNDGITIRISRTQAEQWGAFEFINHEAIVRHDGVFAKNNGFNIIGTNLASPIIALGIAEDLVKRGVQ